MAKTTLSQDERQLIKLVEKLHLPAEDKNGWIERIRTGDMSEELADEIRQKLTGPVDAVAENAEQHTAIRTRNLIELAMLVKRWRLSNQSRNFSRR
jgi:hypothetical protein